MSSLSFSMSSRSKFTLLCPLGPVSCLLALQCPLYCRPRRAFLRSESRWKASEILWLIIIISYIRGLILPPWVNGLNLYQMFRKRYLFWKSWPPPKTLMSKKGKFESKTSEEKLCSIFIHINFFTNKSLIPKIEIFIKIKLRNRIIFFQIQFFSRSASLMIKA